MHKETKTVFTLSVCEIFHSNCEANSPQSIMVASPVPLAGFLPVKEFRACRNASMSEFFEGPPAVPLYESRNAEQHFYGSQSYGPIFLFIWRPLFLYCLRKRITIWTLHSVCGTKNRYSYLTYWSLVFSVCCFNPPLTQVVWHRDYVGNRQTSSKII
jgi:hypothetical protein